MTEAELTNTQDNGEAGSVFKEMNRAVKSICFGLADRRKTGATNEEHALAVMLSFSLSMFL